MSSILNTTIPAEVAKNVDIQIQNKPCAVCMEPSAGYHFGNFTCEGCKSFFGRTYNNVSALGECKNNGNCVINKKNRTSCKSCRLKRCLSVGMSKSGSRYGRRSNWFKIHCLIQDQVEMTGRISADSQTLLSSMGNENQLSGNSNNTGSAAGTPSPSGQNSNNSSQNNGAINSSNNGSDLLSHYKSLKDAELNSSSNSSKLLKGASAAGHLHYNQLLDVAKTLKKVNGSSNSNGNYLPEADTTPLQTKLGGKFAKNLSSHLPLSPVSPLLQSPLFARNLANNIAATPSAQLLSGAQAQANSQMTTQNLLSNALFNPNPLYQNLAANLLPLQPLLQNQNNTVNNLNLTSALNSLNSLGARNNTNTAQQILQQQLLQQFNLAGLNKLFDSGNNDKVKKNNNGPAQAFNEQETPIDLSVKQPGGLDPLAQLLSYANVLKNVDDQSTFSPSSSNEENFGLTGGLPMDQLTDNPSTLLTLMQLTGNKTNLLGNTLLNSLNLGNLNSLNSLAGLGSLGAGNLNDNLNAMNLLNLNNLNNPTSNTETKEEPFDNSEEDTAEDVEDDPNGKLHHALLLNQLNQLNSTNNLLSQLNPSLLNLNNLNSGRNDLTSLITNQMLVEQLKQQNSNASKLTNSPSLDILRKFDSNSNVQKQALNKSTSQAPNSLNPLSSSSNKQQQPQRKKPIELPVRATKQVQSRELVKDKNNNEDEQDEHEASISEPTKSKEEETKSEEDDCQVVKEESAAGEDCTEQPVRSPKKSRKASVEREENDGEDEMSEDEHSQKLNKLNENKRRRRKRSASVMQEKEDFEEEPDNDEAESSKRMKKEHHTDSEPEDAEATQ